MVLAEAESMKRSLKIGLAPVRGMTLIEIMIVVSIIAMVSAGVAVAAFGSFTEARLKQAETDARGVRAAVKSHWLLEATTECPTMDELQSSRMIDEAGKKTDPWGKGWRLNCEGDGIQVISAGPDQQFETQDDIQVPERRSADEG
jgi:prepilin-type N-terminal cleavage/methylation domain-containing protein